MIKVEFSTIRIYFYLIFKVKLYTSSYGKWRNRGQGAGGVGEIEIK